MLTVATMLWDPTPQSFSWSRCYDQTWVEKLYRGFARNLTMPFRFVCWSDRHRIYAESAIKTAALGDRPGYGDVMMPLTTGDPTILVGLDTVVLRNIDHLARWCLESKDDVLALPRDPFKWDQACNGVVLAPANFIGPHRPLDTSMNDMEWCRAQPHVFLDDIFPGSVKSYKGHVLGQSAVAMGERGPDAMKPKGFADVDICYLHGNPKQHWLLHIPEIRDNWK